MSLVIKGSSFNPGKYNNYLIGGNICNAFALGEIGSTEDFFLIGAEPDDESTYPSLTGNILDSEGHVLFRIVKNVLVLNPGQCSKIIGDRLGYEIHDSAGVPVFTVRTQYDDSAGYVTTIGAKFHDVKGKVVFTANSGSSDEKIESAVPSVFGFSGGGFGFVSNFSTEQLEIVRVALLSHGAISQVLSGQISNQEVHLDGKFLRNVALNQCKIVIETGQFVSGPDISISDCTFDFRGPALNVFALAQKLLTQGKPAA